MKRVSLVLSEEMNEALDRLSNQMAITKVEVIRKSIGLMEVIQEEKIRTFGNCDFNIITKNEIVRLIGL